MKLSMQLAVCAVSSTLLGSGLAQADTVLNYTFDSGTYFDFSGGSSNAVTGSFTYDATTQTLSNVIYDRGGDMFTVGATTGPGAQASGPTELYFGDTTSGDYDVYEFQDSLALGGTDPIVSGSHPAIYVGAGGSVTASPASAAPEPASWALMLTGFGLVGHAMRRRAFVASV
jgi:hypothetical protein